MMSPAAQIVDAEAADPEEIEDLGRVLQFVEAELAEGRSFEHMQVVTQAISDLQSAIKSLASLLPCIG